MKEMKPQEIRFTDIPAYLPPKDPNDIPNWSRLREEIENDLNRNQGEIGTKLTSDENPNTTVLVGLKKLLPVDEKIDHDDPVNEKDELPLLFALGDYNLPDPWEDVSEDIKEYLGYKPPVRKKD